ncbi:MAG TPA: xanthine dehydrogenase family protein subunit M [Acidimicrobiia bacterium]|nr:xanthine dehydrogenase family protein subunit M [Acidimicrobiia bacterium]
MAIAHQFAYHKAATLDEAVEVLTRAGPTARVLAGGTDLVPWMRDDAVHPETVVDIKAIDALDEISLEGNHLYLGPLVTFSDLLTSELVAGHLPILREMADTVASPGIRNRATVAGNICSAVPSCDAGPTLLVLEASVAVLGPNGARTVPIEEWFVGPRRTALEQGEIVTGLSIPIPDRPHGAIYLKLQRYEGEDLSQAGVTVLVTGDNVFRIAFGAVGPVPSRARAIEQLLAGKVLSDELVAAAQHLVPGAISPITDMRATKEYRARICEVMLDRGLRAAVARRDGNGPAYGTRLI